jgi:hypothetical protein
LGKVWIGNAVATFGSWTWLFGLGLIFLWWAYRGDKNRPLALGFAGVTILLRLLPSISCFDVIHLPTRTNETVSALDDG